MPKNKKAWCSWNSSLDQDNKENSSVTYWLNQLQNLKISKNIFLTINPFFKIDPNKIYKEIDFTHPYYDENALKNQLKLTLFRISEILCLQEVILVTDFMKMA